MSENMEFVDDLLTFEELGSYLKSQGCHVANLSSLEFSVKNGIGGCLRSLLRQFLMVTVDVSSHTFIFLLQVKWVLT
jgi:origin recognition complex subunit 3